MKIKYRLASALGSIILASSASGAVIGQLGILQDTANGGINPATGMAWAAGDKYRIIFITSTLNPASSTNIADYNTFVQGVAAAAGFGGVSWKAVGSTSAVNAIDNTGTTGTGVGIFNTANVKIADSYTDFWDGNIDAGVNYDEKANLFPNFTNVATGTDANGLGTTDTGSGTAPKVLGGSNEITPNIQYGRSHFSDGRWTRSFSGPASSTYNFYALSEELTVVPEPSTALLGAVGALALLRRRRN
jgi:hypothetical protein